MSAEQNCLPDATGGRAAQRLRHRGSVAFVGTGVIKLLAQLEQEWGLLINHIVADPELPLPTQQHISSRKLPSSHYHHLAEAVKPFPVARIGPDPGAAAMAGELR